MTESRTTGAPVSLYSVPPPATWLPLVRPFHAMGRQVGGKHPLQGWAKVLVKSLPQEGRLLVWGAPWMCFPVAPPGPCQSQERICLQGPSSDLDSQYLLRYLQVKTYQNTGPSLKLWA